MRVSMPTLVNETSVQKKKNNNVFTHDIVAAAIEPCVSLQAIMH